MALLSEHVCYFDDSYNYQIHVVGGYLAPVEVWDNVFVPAWKKVLENAPHPISEFKASDSGWLRGEYESWTAKEVEQLVAELVSVILGTPLYAGVSAALVWPGDPDPASSKVKLWRKQTAQVGYARCIEICLSNAFSLSGQLPETDKIRPVFDKRVKFFKAVGLSFERVRRLLGPELAARVKFPIEGDSKELAQLQAADLLAYETFKEVIARCDGHPPRPTLERLISGRTPYISECIAMPPIPVWELLRKIGEKPTKYTRLYTLFKRGKPLRAPGNWGCDPIS